MTEQTPNGATGLTARTATLRMSTTDPQRWRTSDPLTDLYDLAEVASRDGWDTSLYVADEPSTADEHPERDALLALAAQWESDADDAEHPAGRTALLSARTELLLLLATLSL